MVGSWRAMRAWGRSRLADLGDRQGKLRALAGLWGPVMGALLYFGLPLPLLAMAHGLASLFAFKAWQRPGPGGNLQGRQAALLFFCFPVAGSLGVWWLFPRADDAAMTLFNDYRHYIGHDEERRREASPMGDREAAIRRELSVLPLVDQLRQGDLATKQAAAKALTTLDGQGVRLLRAALVDPDGDTRLFASLALVRKEEEFAASLKHAQEGMAQKGRTPEALMAVAGACRAYAESGLIEGALLQATWRQAQEAAKEALDRGLDETSRLRARLHLAASRAALSDRPGALMEAERALAMAPDCEEAHLRRCETLFSMKDYARLRAAASAMARSATPGSEAYELASFWSGHGS